MPSGHRIVDALATFGPAVAGRHFRSHTPLVQKHQPCRIDLAYRFPPDLAPLLRLGAVLLARVERFFLRRSSSRCSTSHRRVRLSHPAAAAIAAAMLFDFWRHSADRSMTRLQ